MSERARLARLVWLTAGRYLFAIQDQADELDRRELANLHQTLQKANERIWRV